MNKNEAERLLQLRRLAEHSDIAAERFLEEAIARAPLGTRLLMAVLPWSWRRDVMRKLIRNVREKQAP